MMEEEKGSSSGGWPGTATTSFTKAGDRQRFTVELRSDETTIVSWKKLIKDTNNKSKKVNGGPTTATTVTTANLVVPDPKPSNAHPALESRMAPVQPAEAELKDEPPSNRFSAVIEKIERLYMGKDSSDEEDNDMPDDDQYDTEDSFIDDAELDEYFQVDNSATKHNGFFVNRGRLERMNEPPLLTSQQPKKRRRKDVTKAPGENVDGHVPNKHAKVGNSLSGRTTPLAGKITSDLAQSFAMKSSHCEDKKYQNQVKKKSSDIKNASDPPMALKVSNGDVSVSLLETMNTEKHNVGLQSKNHGNKLKDASGSPDAAHPKHHGKGAYLRSRSQSGRQLDELAQPIRNREKSGNRDLQSNYIEGRQSGQATKAPHMHRKDGSSVRPKGSLLERAIRELEKMVAESRPPAMEVQDPDASSQAVKRRLPQEVKWKLAKVARLAQASHGKISKELINRLMGILGHLMQLRTLKRNLKIMVNSGLSAKQAKDDRFHQIKKEVTEMIKARAIPKVLDQAGTSDDFQEFGAEQKGADKRKFSMDNALEDKICDLYDLYVDGLDEDAGPQIRKLYAELAELWPNRSMDNHGIKRAICKSKERKRAQFYPHKDQEKIKRKKLMASKTEVASQVEAISTALEQNMQERSTTDSGNHGLTNSNRLVPNSTMVARVPTPSMNAPGSERTKQEKTKVSSSNAVDEARATYVPVVKKKIKRMPEPELGENYSRPEKVPSQLEEERHKSIKAATGISQKTSNQQAPSQSFEQIKLT